MSVPPPEKRKCDICGGPSEPFDAVKIYTKEYGWFEGMAHTKCLEELNKKRGSRW